MPVLALLAISCGGQPNDEPKGDVASASAPLANKRYVVRRTTDGEPGSLRSTIAAINAQPARSAVVLIASGTHELTLCNADDSNAAGDLDITSTGDVTLVALGHDVIIRQTCAGERVLDAHGAGTLTLERITISGGSLVSAGTETAQGGGVRVMGDLQLEQATITANTARGTGVPGTIPAVQGGGAYVQGNLRGFRATISANAASAGADPNQTPPVVTDADTAEGGGAYVVGAITLQGGSISENRASGATTFAFGPSLPMRGLARGGGIAQAQSSSAPVMLHETSLSDNVSEGGSGYYGGPAEGGAVAATGPLDARLVSATHNRAAGGGSAFGIGGEAKGGALASRGTSALILSRFSGNLAQSGQSFVAPNCPMKCFTSQPAGTAAGGAVWSKASSTVTGCAFDANGTAQNRGGGPSSSRGGALAGDADVTVRGAAFTNNSGPGRGGALSGAAVSLDTVRFHVNRATSAASGAEPWIPPTWGSGGAVDAQSLVADRIDASENEATGPGGGALLVAGDATLRASRIRDNRVQHVAMGVPPQGGGAGARIGGKLTVSDSMFTGNIGSAEPAFNVPTCLSFPSVCAGVFVGGAIAAGSVSGQNVTIAGNTALGFTISVPGNPSSGGGGIAATGDVSLVNATLSGNWITGSAGPDPVKYRPGQGSAILARTITLEQSTLLDNNGVNTHLPQDLPSAAPAPASTLQASSLTSYRSVVIAPAGATVCATGTVVLDSQYNWYSDASCALAGIGDRDDTAGITFGPLAFNGGLVQTQAPAAGSALIDYIPIGACPITMDARGVRRPQGPACDVGAVEAWARR